MFEEVQGQGLPLGCVCCSRGPKAEERVCSRLLHTCCFTGSESNVRHPRPALGGQLLDDFWSRIRWWKGVAKEIAGSLGGRVRAWC